MIKTKHSLLTFYVAQQTLLFGMTKGIQHQRHQTRLFTTEIILEEACCNTRTKTKMMIMESHKEHLNKGI